LHIWVDLTFGCIS